MHSNKLDKHCLPLHPGWKIYGSQSHIVLENRHHQGLLHNATKLHRSTQNGDFHSSPINQLKDGIRSIVRQGSAISEHSCVIDHERKSLATPFLIMVGCLKLGRRRRNACYGKHSHPPTCSTNDSGSTGGDLTRFPGTSMFHGSSDILRQSPSNIFMVQQ